MKEQVSVNIKYERLSYQERIQYHLNPAAKKLLMVMEKKQSNLCIACDVTKKQDLIDIADVLGAFICVLRHILIL
jgi:hypothetical protein